MRREEGVMKYTSFLEECADSIATECRVPSDLSFPGYLRIARYFEQIGDTFGYTQPNSQQKPIEEMMQTHIRPFKVQLHDLANVIPQSMDNTTCTSF